MLALSLPLISQYLMLKFDDLWQQDFTTGTLYPKNNTLLWLKEIIKLHIPSLNIFTNAATYVHLRYSCYCETTVIAMRFLTSLGYTKSETNRRLLILVTLNCNIGYKCLYMGHQEVAIIAEKVETRPDAITEQYYC